MSTIQKDLSLSILQTYKLAKDMRLVSGSREIIDGHFKETASRQIIVSHLALRN